MSVPQFIHTWHLDLAVVGLVAGAFAFARRRMLAPALGAVVTSLALVTVGVAELTVVAAMLLAGTATRCRRAAGTALPLGAVVLLAVSQRNLNSPVWATMTVAGAVLTIGLPPATRRIGPLVVPHLITGTLAIAWLCVPDTEEVVLVGAAALVTSLAALVHKRRGPDDQTNVEVDWRPLALLGLWAITTGFRGRTGGLPAAWVPLAALVAWPLFEALADRTMAGPRSRGPWWPPLLVTALLAGFTARTVGLGTDLGTGTGWAVAATSALWVVWATRARGQLL